MKKIILLLAITASMPAFAEQNAYELTQVKAGKLTVTKSNQSISLITEESYDKYIISVSGDGGFSHQFESDSPSLVITDLNLPYDGTYNYEIRSVKYVAEAKNALDNGRSADAMGKISIVDVQSGKFTSSYGEMLNTQDIKEPIKGSFPNKTIRK